MRSADTSVLVAALASWHEHHDAARAELDDCVLIGHTALELLSILTRLPEPHRVDASIVVAFLDASFPDPPLALPSEAMAALPHKLAGLGVVGGAVYDGLIALTAQHHGASLVTLDERAVRTYDRLGVDHVVL